jgi:hypothetical protein
VLPPDVAIAGEKDLLISRLSAIDPLSREEELVIGVR